MNILLEILRFIFLIFMLIVFYVIGTIILIVEKMMGISHDVDEVPPK